ncbi:ubiquitin carboxyl-terminal hydrolase 16/45 [Musca vetustissima]|uniref:ubiquitin carboxyl-terminal hydrolase 16/45 n=1 Tax=Musca vetustissima TaxID=27455 RepID=UPI002AB7B5A7|nr:ubiquitin carboxyl-terminal hydrolase 16/45 [Musca vetustissima]
MGKNHQPDNWDDGSSDSGEEKTSPTAVTRSCPHLKRAVDSAKLRKLLKGTGLLLDCTECQRMGFTSPATEASESPSSVDIEYDNTLWLCLKCGSQLCGRSKNQHALHHFKTPRSDCHALAMNTRSFDIWCYDCDNDVKPDSRKNLLDCVEFVKGLAQKPPVQNVENMILGAWESLRPLVSTDDNLATTPQSSGTVNTDCNNITGINKAIPLPAPPLPPIPGMAKRTNNEPLVTTYSNFNNLPPIEPLPRVRGLTNLGNTCFFNAVLQCLAQTPYLLDVLKESAEPGEEFTLPGGTFDINNDEVLKLPPIKGTLTAWGGLTSALANTLEELQSGGGVFNPSKLLNKLTTKCPQFQGGDQHDSHELLRQLLESVRSEDLKRYQRVILQNLGCKDQDAKSASDDMKRKCKIYGNQAADRILMPEKVFRGFLVSTLTCQDCYNVSSRHEYFLDMSLPVSVEKSQPPAMRRKTSPDNANSFYLHPAPATSPTGPTKSQLKKEAKKERKAKRHAKHQHTKQQIQKVGSAEGQNSTPTSGEDAVPIIGCATREEADDRTTGALSAESSSSAEQSDADVEDNLLDDNDKCPTKPLNTSANAKALNNIDRNGNNQLTSPVEKRGDSPENMDKDSLDEDENDSGIATSPANAGGASFPASSTSNSETNGDANIIETKTTNSVFSLGLNEKGANLLKQLSNGINTDETTTTLTNGDIKSEENGDNSAAMQSVINKLDRLQIENDEQQQKKSARAKAKRSRTQSYSDWSTTIAPRYQCEDGECSVQSCLNNFTAVELMTGNNKVGCEACTKRINGDDPKAKTVNTNATKQFLISSPPAVLILHLKRFQLGQRFVFRKLTGHVSFPMILDIAPFCGSKVKNLPNIDRKQKKLLYALYGVVEHSGSMYGGHYTAYVKVRPKLSKDDKRWKFIPQGSKAELDQDDEQRKKLEELLAREKARDLRMKAANDSDDFSNSCNSSLDSSASSSSSEPDDSPTSPDGGHNDEPEGAVGGIDEAINVQVPMGKWYYVSDSRVSDASESEVLKAQAYLLFYERIY